jgi:hypothetical protein
VATNHTQPSRPRQGGKTTHACHSIENPIRWAGQPCVRIQQSNS